MWVIWTFAQWCWREHFLLIRYFHSLEPRLHGGYGQWGRWANCNSNIPQCSGGGVRIRTRECSNPHPQSCGRGCAADGLYEVQYAQSCGQRFSLFFLFSLSLCPSFSLSLPACLPASLSVCSSLCLSQLFLPHFCFIRCLLLFFLAYLSTFFALSLNQW